MALGVGLLAGSFAAVGASAQENRNARPNPLARDEAKRGMAQFQQTCAMCHGSEAKGGTGPNLLESSLVRHDVGGNLIAEILHEGRMDKGMPAFPTFSATQVSDLVGFLHAAVDASDNRSSRGPASGYTMKALLTGDVQAGKRFFDGPGKCATCHSATGDLKGVARKYTARELEGQLLYPIVKSQTAVVTLPSGETVEGQVLHNDAFYVSLLDASGVYRSFPLRHGVTVKVADPLREHMALLERYKDQDIHDVFAYLETLQ